MSFRKRRSGFSLLEVILSIAILGGSMVVIGHGFFQGFRSVRNARMVSQANRLADSTMAGLAAGVIEASAVSSKPIDGERDWAYSVEIGPSSQPGLLTAKVTVQNTGQRPIAVTIMRLVVDPDFDPLESQGSE